MKDFLQNIQQAIFRQGLEPSHLNTIDERTQFCTALRRGRIDVSQIPGRQTRVSLLKSRAVGEFDPYGIPLSPQAAKDLLEIGESSMEEYVRQRSSWIEE